EDVAQIVLFLAVGLGALKLLHRDAANQIQNWLQHWQVVPGNHYLQAAMSKVSHIDNRNVALLSAITLFYAAEIALVPLKRSVRYASRDYIT
ncbi:MAG: DUF2127 domain-containing protein, partial [Verrucomicrobiota bacterium]